MGDVGEEEACGHAALDPVVVDLVVVAVVLREARDLSGSPAVGSIQRDDMIGRSVAGVQRHRERVGQINFALVARPLFLDLSRDGLLLRTLVVPNRGFILTVFSVVLGVNLGGLVVGCV